MVRGVSEHLAAGIVDIPNLLPLSFFPLVYFITNNDF